MDKMSKKVRKRRKEEERLSNLLHTTRRYMAGAFLRPYKILKISDNAYYYILYKQIAARVMRTAIACCYRIRITSVRTYLRSRRLLVRWY